MYTYVTYNEAMCIYFKWEYTYIVYLYREFIEHLNVYKITVLKIVHLNKRFIIKKYGTDRNYYK